VEIKLLENRKLKIGIVVGEVSGDTLGAKLIRSFREQGIEAEFEGIGGPQMMAEGFKSYYPMDILSVMGIVEVLKDLKKLFAVRDGLVERWSQKPVDIFIGIDAPDFNLRLSKSLKQKQLKIKTVQYVSPSVWAWRQGRVHGIKQSIERLGPLVLDAAQIIYQKYPEIEFLLPAINEARKVQIEEQLKNYPAEFKAQVKVLENTGTDSKIGRMVMNASDIVALASGTATLEAMLLHRPMVTFYKLNWLTYIIAKLLVKIPYYSLPNIIAGKKVIAELIQTDATAQKLATEIENLMNREVAQTQVMQHIAMHKRLLAGNSENPVEAILKVLSY